MILLFVGIVAGGTLLVIRAARTRRLAEADALTTAVLTGTILWVLVVGNLLDVGENYRFRFLTLPAQFVVGASLIARYSKKSGGE